MTLERLSLEINAKNYKLDIYHNLIETAVTRLLHLKDDPPKNCHKIYIDINIHYEGSE